ncbi:MAG TPA: formate dehydrogenase subunit alpha [Candidatus Margulisbacteria bacterium]|nr:MAG: formate dehydrogenase subunit alpha [Candidatus Margulisbacteria bacterium GWF2_38_17]OGI07549.1 MAG: formate dehydrogenase subunit alpha [Candidatus Margulisbacteria bacterium GWE2_39_32]HCT85500.1 formate dehydrogenase subunit alpha [Candidatus Margulisiibacteriota bacterium]
MKITINGRTVEAHPGQTVLQAARAHGFYVPTLCYHEKTGPASKCRICVVEIAGMRGLQTSCSVAAQDGMDIKTETEEIISTQKSLVNLLLASGEHNCLACEKSGNCELQDVAYHFGIEKPSIQFANEFDQPDTSSPFVIIDRKKCISCGRCVAACNNVVVNNVLDLGFRGRDTKVICDDDKPMGESTCVQCGECSQLCPVGAIIDKKAIGKARNWETKKVRTTCPYCGVGCQLILHVNEKTNTIVKITGEEDAVNNGMLCVKGRFGFDFVNSNERLTTPLIRDKKGGELKETTWEEAISFISKKLTEIKTKHGPDAIAGLASAKVSNEENYIFQKFVRSVIGTNNVDHCARLCHASTVAGLAQSFGSGAMTNDIAGIKEADVALLIGSNTSEAHPVIGSVLKQAVKHGKTKLIIIDPKDIPMSKHAAINVRQRCGTDVAVLNGIMNIIINNSWYDKNFVETRCENFEAFKEEVAKYPANLVAEISGIPADKLEAIAKLFGKAKNAAIFYSMGITQHTTGVDNVCSVANLQMLCGNIGRPGVGVNALRGQNNVQGACDMGALPNVYPGYQAVTDENARLKFQTAWNTTLTDKIGLTVTEMLTAADEGILKAIYIMGENPMLSDPDSHHTEHSLKGLELLVVQDIFMTETAQLADVVLPTASYAEKDGTFANTERRVQRIRKAIKSPGLAKEDWQIVQDIANSMGAGWSYTTAQDISKEINKLTPQYAGISWERLEGMGLTWPCPNSEHPGTPILHTEKFTRGLGMFKAIPYIPPAELPDQNYPLVLTTGRVLEQFHTGTMTRKTDGLNQLAGPMVMISIADAQELGIADKETIKITSRRGEIQAPAFVTDGINKGTIFMPFHYKEAAANVLTNTAVDPIAKIPEFKVCAVKVSKI